MKTAKNLPEVKRGPNPGEKVWNVFAEALKISRGRWVNVECFTSNHGYKYVRDIKAGRVDVPRGADGWEFRVVPQMQDDGRTFTDVWARPT